VPAPPAPGPCIYALTGYPGTGKYTVAKELVAQLVDLGRPVRLMDNHETGNPILRLIEIEPGTPIPGPNARGASS
jgi:KaiC/GvpD/RAD55 family RecA-like ATPase